MAEAPNILQRVTNRWNLEILLSLCFCANFWHFYGNLFLLIFFLNPSQCWPNLGWTNLLNFLVGYNQTALCHAAPGSGIKPSNSDRRPLVVTLDVSPSMVTWIFNKTMILFCICTFRVHFLLNRLWTISVCRIKLQLWAESWWRHFSPALL